MDKKLGGGMFQEITRRNPNMKFSTREGKEVNWDVGGEIIDEELDVHNRTPNRKKGGEKLLKSDIKRGLIPKLLDLG